MTSPRILGLLLAASTIWSGTALAQGSGSEAGKASPPDPRVAATLSVVAPLLGYGLIAASLDSHGEPEPGVLFISGAAVALIGPSAGNIYAGEGSHAVLFSLGRVAFASLALAGVAELLGHAHLETTPPNRDQDHLFIGIGLAGVLALTVWEPIDSYYSAEKSNRRPKSVAVTPYFGRPEGTASSTSAGLLLFGQF